MALQAWFDDSGTKGTGRFMSMAGLFGSAETFAEIADAWDRYLPATQPGRIGYFKLDEALSLDGEFSHWQEHNRDLKVQQMARLVDRDDVIEVTASVDLHAFAAVFPMWSEMRDYDSGKHHALNQPYILLFQYVLNVVVGEAVRRGSTNKLEIIFDNHDVFRRPVVDAYEYHIREEIDPAHRAVMPKMPFFRDDKEFVVLQAADLLAGEMRLLGEHLAMGRPMPQCLRGVCPCLKQSGHFAVIDENMMKEMDQYTRGSYLKHLIDP